MSNARLRFVEFERAQIDMETGEFPMVLATDGEASDGDILSVEGAQFTSRAPLQLSHINDPTATLGSVSGFRRDLVSSPKKLKARGQIELTGEGPNAEIRRDLAHMIQQGHVTGISVRWEPLKFTPRMALPKDHPAHVSERETDFRKRGGFYHEKWRVLEGSVVAVQADKAAMIGRAEETQGAVAEFWRAMAEDAQPRESLERATQRPDPNSFDSKDAFMAACMPMAMDEGHPQDQATAMCSSMWDERSAGGAGAAPTPPTPSPEALKAAFAAQVRELTERAGIALDELNQIIEEQRPAPIAPAEAQLREQLSTLEARLVALEGRVSAEPLPAIHSIDDINDQLTQKLDKSRARVRAAFQALLDKRRGKVPQGLSYREQLHAEADLLLREAHGADQALLAELERLVAAARARHEAAAREKENAS